MTTERKHPQECLIKHPVAMDQAELALRDEALLEIKKLCSTLPPTDYTPLWDSSSEWNHAAILSFFSAYAELLNKNQVDIYSDLQFIIQVLSLLNYDIEARSTVGFSEDEKKYSFESARFKLAEFISSRQTAAQLDNFKDLADKEAKNSPFSSICQTIHSEYAKRLKNGSFSNNESDSLYYARHFIASKNADLSEFKELLFNHRFLKRNFNTKLLNHYIDDIFDRACEHYIHFGNSKYLINYHVPSLKLVIKLAQSPSSDTTESYIKEFLSYITSTPMDFTSKSVAEKFNKFVILMLNTFPENGDNIDSKSLDTKLDFSFEEMKFLASDKVNDSCFNAICDALGKDGGWGDEKELVNKDIKEIIDYFERERREAKDQVSEEFYEDYFKVLVEKISCKEFQFNLMRSMLLERTNLLPPILRHSAKIYINNLANGINWDDKINSLIQLSSILYDLDKFNYHNEKHFNGDAQKLGTEIYSDTSLRIHENFTRNKIDKNDLNLLSNLRIVTDLLETPVKQMEAYEQLQNIVLVLPGKGNARRERAGRILQYAALAVGVLAPAAIFVASGGSACLGLQIGIAVTAVLIIGIGECIKRSYRDTGAAKNLLAWLPKVAPNVPDAQLGSEALLESKP